jgi:ATP-dependent helicase/nuclease subunit B
LKESAYKVVLHLVEEFSQCEFTPADFELRINNDGQIPPYEINLDNGGVVKIVGSIDRVDTYETEDNTFVRVIDYKTGGKKFELGEVFYGLNMQMLIYLFAIWQNGQDYYKNATPAGVLYFQAKSPKVSSKKITRESTFSESRVEYLNELKMHGMVLNNANVVEAMEKDCAGVFVPASYDKTGALKGNIISLKSLSILKERVNDSIKNMAQQLQNGNIGALPVEKGCTYCNYKDVCKREENDPVREMSIPSFDDAISMLRGDVDGEKMD